jgi:hypothetical protein
MFHKRLLLLLALLLALPAGLIAAQDTPAATEEAPAPGATEEASEGAASSNPDAVASGLNNPRHIFFGSDGTLYIAEAGVGGDMDSQGPFGPVKAGTTAQVSAVAPDGTQSVVVPELVSMDAGFGQIEGVTSVTVTDTSYWLTLGMGTQEPLVEGAQVESVVEIDKATGEVLQTIDLRTFETDNNPDEAREVVSNPADLAVGADGALYIADASGNSLLKWTEADGLTLFAAWPASDDPDIPQSVPTSVAVGPDGDIYVGFLSGFPFPVEGARIERLAPDGSLKETYEDLTYVTDILVTAEGTVYAVEMAGGYGDVGFNPDSGRVVKIVDGEIGVVRDGLNYPYGIAQDAEGNLFVTVNSAFVAPGGGEVIPVGGI